MKNQKDTTDIKTIQFTKITEQSFDKINLSDLKYFIISRSGLIDTPGNIYFFTSKNAFLMNKCGYQKDFIDKFLSKINIQNWEKINLYFCDDLFINIEIYDSFIKELCAKNIRDFWFETALDIFKNRAFK